LALSKCRDVEEEGWGFTFDAEREAVTFWTSFDGVQRAQVNVRTGVMSDAPPDQGRRALWELAKTTAQAFGLWPYRSNFIPETYLGAIDRFYDLETSLLHLYGLHPSPAHEEIDLCPDLADKYLSRKFSPDGRYVFCHAWELRGKDLFLDASYLWDLRSRTMVTRLNHRESRLGQTGRRFGGAKVDGWFSPDSRALITAGDREDGLSVWEVEHGRRVRTLPTEAIPAAFSADSRRLVLVAAHHMMEVWDVASGAMCQSLGPNPGPFNVVKASADARTVAGWSFGIDTELAASWGVEPRHEWFSIWTAPSRRDQ
jgi:WD40 repeat protein